MNNDDTYNLEEVFDGLIEPSAPPARVFSAQARTVLQDKNGRCTETSTTPKIEKVSPQDTINEQAIKIKDLENKLKQADESKEQYKLKRKQDYEKRLARRQEKVESGQPKKKTATIFNERPAIARATGCMLLPILPTCPPDSDSDEEEEQAPGRERDNLLRFVTEEDTGITMEVDRPQSTLKELPESLASNIILGIPDEDILKKTGRNYAMSHSHLPGKPWYSIEPNFGSPNYDSDDEMPELECDGVVDGIYMDLGPHLINPVWNEKGMGNCAMTITSDSQMTLKNGIIYVRVDGKYIPQSFFKRGPIRPSQKLLHMHANFPYLL